MKAEIKEKLDIVKKILTEAENYAQAGRVLAYDQETICPPKGMERQGEVMAFLNNQAFKLIKSESFTRYAGAATATIHLSSLYV